MANGQPPVNGPAIEIEFSYVWNTPAGGLGANASLLGNTLPISNDADFKLLWRVSTQTGTFKIKVYDGSTGRAFSSDFVNNANYFGTAQLPFPVLPPYVFKAGGSISFDITDTSGAGNTIQLVWNGMKLFANPQSGSAGRIQSM